MVKNKRYAEKNDYSVHSTLNQSITTNGLMEE